MDSARNGQSLELHAIILTLDEEQHIRRCIASIQAYCTSILVIDSGSRDRTLEIAQEMGAETVMHPFTTHAAQVNAAIDMLANRSGWRLRIDADEFLESGSGERMLAAIRNATVDCAGLTVRRHIRFLGRRIRWGGIEPNPQLRLWRAGLGRSEERWMDEHIVVNGKVIATTVDMTDDNLNSVTWWTAKHNGYASREAVQVLLTEAGQADTGHDNARLAIVPSIKRALKIHVYSRLPLALRSMAYACFRYVLLLGFLDGRQGFYFHFLQGFWYRTLVDAKITEVKLAMHRNSLPLDVAIQQRLGVSVPKAAPTAGRRWLHEPK
jgi:glycosyltransferase involved in cell wall biosynthesis